MGRHSFVGVFECNFGISLGVVGNLNAEISTQHSLNAFDFNIVMFMSYALNPYVDMPSSCVRRHSISNFEFNTGFPKTNNVLSTPYWRRDIQPNR